MRNDKKKAMMMLSVILVTALVFFLLPITNLIAGIEEHIEQEKVPAREADNSTGTMIVGIASTYQGPTIQRIEVFPGNFNARIPAACNITKPGENHRPLLYIRDNSGQLLFKTAFDYPVAMTVPLPSPLASGQDNSDSTGDPTIPDLIFLDEPEAYLRIPCFKAAHFFEIYQPYHTSPSAVENMDRLEAYHKVNYQSFPTPSQAETTKGETDEFHVLIMASGYTSAELDIFRDKAGELKSYLLSKEPFASQTDRINVHVYENLLDIGCHSGCSGIPRLLCCNTIEVLNAAQNSGYAYDEIIVIHHTGVYSGGGYRENLDAYKLDSASTYASVYDGPSFKQMVLHEFGHSFGNLCDEYTYDPGYYYKLCVNCRVSCNDWALISDACQQGCDAEGTYYRPTDSIMLKLSVHEYNLVSIYSKNSPDGLLKRLYFFTHTVDVVIQAKRTKEKAWIISRDFGDISFSADYAVSVSISKFIISRKTAGTAFQVIKEVLPPELDNGNFSYQDKYLEKNVTYIYKVEAVDASGNIIGTSLEKSI